MYNSYFGFSDLPFENNPDDSFLFLSKDHREALSALIYFVTQRKGFALVCGDVGTGKTTIINALLNNLPGLCYPFIISNPQLAGYEPILCHIAEQLKIGHTGLNSISLIGSVKAALLELTNKGRTYILIIDEAHLLSDQDLEGIRLLSNIETPTQKLLQILLVGQYEISYRLNRPEMRQLRQRININRFLSPMEPVETNDYIDHRLRVVGSSFDSCFETECKGLIHELSGGIPRQINHICDNALLICKADGLKKVDRAVLRKAFETLQSDLIFTPKEMSAQKSVVPSERMHQIVFAAFCVVVLMLAGNILYTVNLHKRFLESREIRSVARGVLPLVEKHSLSQNSPPERTGLPLNTPTLPPSKQAETLLGGSNIGIGNVGGTNEFQPSARAGPAFPKAPEESSNIQNDSDNQKKKNPGIVSLIGNPDHGTSYQSLD